MYLLAPLIWSVLEYTSVSNIEISEKPFIFILHKVKMDRFLKKMNCVLFSLILLFYCITIKFQPFNSVPSRIK